jgi:hypothetical protein
MKALRVLLQIVIVVVGGLVLAAFIAEPRPDLTAIIVFSGFVALLLALTMALKEQTETRLIPNHKTNFRPMGVVLMLLGAFGIFYSISFYVGTQALPNGSGRCRAICGFILLATQQFGESGGRLVASVLWFLLGVGLFTAGYKIRNVQAT